MQMKEVAIKEGELQRKMQKDQTDAMLKKRQQDLEAARVQADNMERTKQANISAASKMADIEETRKQKLMDIGVDVLKHLSDKSNTRKEK